MGRGVGEVEEGGAEGDDRVRQETQFHEWRCGSERRKEIERPAQRGWNHPVHVAHWIEQPLTRLEQTGQIE